MKVVVKVDKSNKQNCDGYELHIIDDLGQVEVKPILRKDKQSAGNYCYKLPDNPSNLKWLSDKRICDGYELTYKEPVNRTIAKQPWWDFLDATEKEQYNKLKALGEKRQAEYAKKQQSPEAKLEAQIAKLQAQLEKLKAAE